MNSTYTHKILCDSTCPKVPVVGRLFELWWCKVKISLQIWSQGKFWDFIYKYFGFFNTYSLNCLKDLMLEWCFYVINGLLNCYCTSREVLYVNTLPRFPNFFQNQLFTICYMAFSIKWSYLQNAMSDFKSFCAKIGLKEQPYSKKSTYKKPNQKWMQGIRPV